MELGFFPKPIFFYIEAKQLSKISQKQPEHFLVKQLELVRC